MHYSGLRRFTAEEKALGNLPVESEGKAKRAYKVTPLRDYLKHIFMVRPAELADGPAEAADPPAEELKRPAADDLSCKGNRYKTMSTTD